MAKIKQLSAAAVIAAAGFMTIGGAALAPAAHAASYGSDSRTLSASSANAQPGGSVTVSGNGFAANSRVRVTLESAGGGSVFLATLTTDASGAFSSSVTIPSSTARGSYALTASGVTSGGAARVLSTPFVVGSLPFTGAAAIVPLSLVSVGALAGGTVLLAAGRKRKNP